MSQLEIKVQMGEAECNFLVIIQATGKMVEGQPSYSIFRVDIELSLGQVFSSSLPLQGLHVVVSSGRESIYFD